MTYPTLPFALVYQLAQITPERANFDTDNRHVSIFTHQDRMINAVRLTTQDDSQLSAIEAEVAKQITANDFDTVTLTFSTTGSDPRDLGVIIEKDKKPVIFLWQWAPIFGITLIEDEQTEKDIDNWSGVRLARDMVAKQK